MRCANPKLWPDFDKSMRLEPKYCDSSVLVFYIVSPKMSPKPILIFKLSVEWNIFWQFLMIVIIRPKIREEANLFCNSSHPHVPLARQLCCVALILCGQTSNSSFLLPHLVTISVRSKFRDSSFWWRSLHEVSTSQRYMLSDQWRRTHIKVYPGGWSHYTFLPI